jgi:crotonobetaine/carnitine-CoA ligase
MSTGWQAVDERLTLPQVVDQQAERRPAETCLHVGPVQITCEQLAERSIRAANTLAGLGIGHGDRVAIFMETAPEWLDAWFGAARLGAVAVPVNTAFRGDFLANQLRGSGTKLVVLDEALVPRLRAVASEIPELQAVLVRRSTEGTAPDLALPPALQVETAAVLLEGDGGIVSGGRAPTWDEPGAIMYTSGTTGPSKGALASHQYLIAAGRSIAASWHIEPGEVVYGPLPLFHISCIGTVLGPLTSGAAGALDPVFSVTRCWDRIREVNAVGALLAGAMVRMLVNLPPDPGDRDLPLRFISAAPVPDDLYPVIERRYGCRILTSYGMTEAFPLTLAGVGDDLVPGTSGRANPNFEVAVFDDDDQLVPPGTVGEIVCRPRRPHVMFDGYLGQWEATVQRWRNLWFHTGDLGRLDAGGSLTFVDRKKDALRRRGENISSFEVEQAVLRHAAVAASAVVGVPSELGEDDVMVCLVLKPGHELLFDEFLDFCVERLPYFAVPRYVEVFEELPMNASGKILKAELRARGVTPATWDREAAGHVVRR